MTNPRKPAENFPEDGPCQCAAAQPIKLVQVLTENPLRCMNCNLEIPPETLALPQDLSDSIVHWNSLYHAIYLLWLDSGPYEIWAREQLSDVNRPINLLGRDVQHELNTHRRCYYWLFQDESTDEYQPLRLCPVCGDPLQDYRPAMRVCERDSIAVAGDE